MQKIIKIILIVYLLVAPAGFYLSQRFEISQLPVVIGLFLGGAILSIILLLTGKQKNLEEEKNPDSEGEIFNIDQYKEFIKKYEETLKEIPELTGLFHFLEKHCCGEPVFKAYCEALEDIALHLKKKANNERWLSFWMNNGLEILSIMGEMSGMSRNLEEKTIIDITDQFNEIWENSESIMKDIENTAGSLFASEGTEGLLYLTKTSNEVNVQIENSMDEMENLEGVMHQFIESSRHNLTTVLKTADDIQDIAEQIKIVSINMRIEAAKLGSINSGFHVLGQEITKLADETTKISESTSEHVNMTMSEVSLLEEKLRKSLNMVEKDNSHIKEAFSPMGTVLQNSYRKLEDILGSVQLLSYEISHNTKQSIGKLQFSDVTGQERQHRQVILENIRRQMEENLQHLPKIPDDERAQIRFYYLKQLRKICSTKNEIDILNRYNIEDDQEIIERSEDLGEDGVLLF